MARNISNMEQLASAMTPILKNMVDQMVDRVYEFLFDGLLHRLDTFQL